MADTRLLWIVAGGVCIVSTVPLSVLLLIPCCIFAFLIGFLGFIIKKEYDKKSYANIDLVEMSPNVGIPMLIKELRNKQKINKLDRRMTGSNLIDDVLHEIIDYAYRDYVNSWFKKLSDNDARFKIHTRASLQYMITNLSDRIKDVDLIKFLSEDLVDLVTTHVQIYRQALEKAKKANGNPKVDESELEKCFFQLEETTTKQNLCRDDICMKTANEKEYMQVVSEILLYLLLPDADFKNKSLRYIMREIITNAILLPFVDMISDPDYINETILHTFGDSPMTCEVFLIVVKYSDSIDELKAILQMLDTDISRQRSRDAGGDSGGDEAKRILGSLYYVQTLCEKRIKQLSNMREDEPDAEPVPAEIDDERYALRKAYNLPFDVTIQNNTAISYFLEFLTSIGSQAYIFFYLTVAGYRSSTKTQMSSSKNDASDMDIIREAAIDIYNEYLSEKSASFIELDSITLRQLKSKIYGGKPNALVFDEVQQMVSNIMKYDPKFYSSFRNHMCYIQMLTHLDLPREGADLDKLTTGDNRMKGSTDNYENLSSSTQLQGQSMYESNLVAQITNTGTCQEFGQTYTIYFISVKRNKGEYQESWDIYRRYSDFHEMHSNITEKYPALVGLNLPGKKTFNNMNRDFLEKRSLGLNSYLQTLLSNRILKCHAGLERIVFAFLDNVALEKDKNAVIRKIVNPLKASVASVGHIVKSMPDNVIGGVTRVSEGILSIPNSMIDGMGKILQNKTGISRSSSCTGDNFLVKASCLETEGDSDNLPLRIMLQMMDEIFDLRLKTKSDWLYKKIVDIIRGIIKKFYGDNLNRKIVDTMMYYTSAEQVTIYLKTFRDSFWPNGVLASSKESRDVNIKLRTQIVCKTLLINTITEELRAVMGTEVTRKGALRVFNMLQTQKINKRLIYVILEGVLKILFPSNKFDVLFNHMHGKVNVK